MTHSSFSAGSLPSIFATTFADGTFRIVFTSEIDAVAPRGTGWKSRVAAFALSASKSCPAIAKRAFAWSRVIQPSTAARDALPSAVSRSSCSVVLPCTIANG